MGSQTDTYDFLESCNISKADIHFKSLPTNGFLDVLDDVVEGPLRLHFPLETPIGAISDLEESGWIKNIVKAHLTSDIFVDSECIWNFANIERLVLSCDVSENAEPDERDLSAMQHAIAEGLCNLKEIVIVLVGRKNPRKRPTSHALEFVQSYLHWPNANFKFRVVTGQRRAGPEGRIVFK